MISKSLLSLSMLVLSAGIASAQITEGEKTLITQSSDSTQGWKHGGVFSVSLSQTSLKNWSAGGQNSVAINGLLSLFANYRKGKSVLDNSLDIGYGLLKQGRDADFFKTDDKVDFLSKYGREAFKNFYYAALFNLKTQMRPGYRYPDKSKKISDLFAPAYVLFAAGLDFKPSAYFSAFAAPITAKITIVADDSLSAAGAFGVTQGEKSRAETGGYVRIIYTKNDFKNEMLKDVSFTSKLDLFSNYRDKPQNIDVSWETLIALKVNKYITVSFNTHLLYDDNILIPIDRNENGLIDPGEAPSKRIQFKEILGAGFSYKF
ncbi:MAG: DUF3078 domain-containing protein [Bacteroidales bacterium]|nr:DUF3078 domain-containing protein [Bacteroidales bacterium]